MQSKRQTFRLGWSTISILIGSSSRSSSSAQQFTINEWKADKSEQVTDSYLLCIIKPINVFSFIHFCRLPFAISHLPLDHAVARISVLSSQKWRPNLITTAIMA